MFDLLRFARAARSFGFLVGLGRITGFRTFAVVLACIGIGLSIAGPGLTGVAVAVAVFCSVAFLRTITRGNYTRGAHRD